MFKHSFSKAHPQRASSGHCEISRSTIDTSSPGQLRADCWCGNCLYRNQLRIPGNLAKWMVGGQQNHAARGGHLQVQYLWKIFKQFVKNIWPCLDARRGWPSRGRATAQFAKLTGAGATRCRDVTVDPWSVDHSLKIFFHDSLIFFPCCSPVRGAVHLSRLYRGQDQRLHHR